MTNHVVCALHGFKNCMICDKLPDECDFGSCVRTSISTVPCYNEQGKHVEGRHACSNHANSRPGFGVGYGKPA